MSEQAAKKNAGSMIVGYFRDFGVLRETRKEFWGIQIVNLLDCTFYFAMLTVASLFLSSDLGMSDKNAGYTIAVFTSATTLMLTFSGAISDWLGIRRSLRFTMVAMLVLRLAVVGVGLLPALPYRGFLAALLLLLMAPFMASIQTIFQSATQRFTTARSRSAGFNLWYLFMNIGAAAGGLSIDVVRLHLKVANVHIFTMGVGMALLCLAVGEWLVVDEKQLHGAGEPPETAQPPAAKKRPREIFKDVVREPAFFRLTVLIALILGVRAVYAYLYLLMPKYWERTIGADAAIGGLNMINPIGIVIGLILFIPFANKFRVFSLLIYGAIVSSLALVPLAMSWQAFVAPAASIHQCSTGFLGWLGSIVGSETLAHARYWWMMNGSAIANAHVLMAILCMVIVTVGEVLWSPKLNEYTAAIAPQGQEGTYLGLSMIPWFAAKTLVGAASGHMLTRWSPEKVAIDGVEVPLQQAMNAGKLGYWNSPAAMWLWLLIWAIVGCGIALVFRRWLTKGVRENAPATGAT